MGDRNKKPYVRQTAGRLEWDDKLHSAFEKAVIKLGGVVKAKAKSITSLLQESFPFIKLPHVSSHLQKYREKRGIRIRSKNPNSKSNEEEPSTSNSPKRRVLHNKSVKHIVDELPTPSSPSSDDDSGSCSANTDEASSEMMDVVYALMNLEYCGANEMNYSKALEHSYSAHVQCK